MEQSVISAQKQTGLSGSALKWIAIGSMLLDHVGAVLLEGGLMGNTQAQLDAFLLLPSAMAVSLADLVLRMIGRLAFPIFCFLLVQGFLHTRSAPKYLARLAVFALISEVPFDLAVADRWFDPSYQNVFFTLALGLLVLMAMRRCEQQGYAWAGLLAAVAGSAAALALRTDYDATGILLIVVFYVLRNKKSWCFILAGALLVRSSWVLLGTAALALIPIHLYNGQKGRALPKYLIYCFYPAHLLALFLIRRLAMGVPG